MAVHALTVLAVRARIRAWAVAVIVAAAAAVPVVVFAYIQRGATSWLPRPGRLQVGHLVTSMAGSAALIVLFGALAVIAVGAGLAASLPAERAAPVRESAPPAPRPPALKLQPHFVACGTRIC